MSFKDQALAYHRRGWNVLPIWPHGVNNSNGKDKPVFKWEQWQTNKQTEAEVMQWIEKYPDCNIAVITGTVNNLLVLDFDNEEACADFQMEHEIPPTLISKTSKGHHFYFSVADEVAYSSYVAVLPHVDVRCNGGYVIAPDSKHSSGFIYKWENDNPIAEMPEFVAEIIDKRKKKSTETVPRTVEKWVDELWQGVKEGGRNASCARLTGYYIAKGMGQSEIISLLKGWNRLNTPQMPEKEIEITVKSVFNKSEAETKEESYQSDAMPLSQCKRAISKWIYYKDDNVIDLALAVASSTQTDQDPSWLVFIGAASTGKTELLKAFDNYPNTHFLDRVTPPAFATGFKATKGLLERVNGRKMLLVIQDLSTFFSKSQQETSELFDILRQVFNGKYYNEWGSGKKVIWQGKFNCLTASTPEIESRSMGELGERFMYYRLHSNDEDTRNQMKTKARESHGKEIEARKEIKEAIHGALEHIRKSDIKTVRVNDEMFLAIENLVDAITSLRSPVKRNQFRQEQIEYEPMQEGPARMLKMMLNLGQALAAVRGRTDCNEEDLKVLRKIGMDSLPSMRRRVLRSLILNKERGFLKAKDLAEDCSYTSTASTTYRLEDLTSLGACLKQYERKIPDSFGRTELNAHASAMFMLNPSYHEMLVKAGVIELALEDVSSYRVEKAVEDQNAVTVTI